MASWIETLNSPCLVVINIRIFMFIFMMGMDKQRETKSWLLLWMIQLDVLEWDEVVLILAGIGQHVYLAVLLRNVFKTLFERVFVSSKNTFSDSCKFSKQENPIYVCLSYRICLSLFISLCVIV